ncbi:MAG: hypothetical protein ACYDB7_10235, partial [Mycobacteriales bacterium]
AEAGESPGPETAKPRAEVTSLGQADKKLRTRHAAEVAELRTTVATYANQIQLLALRVDQLEVDNRRMLHSLQVVGDNVTQLPARN